jgi:uroporphyrinogen-III synthase
MVLGALSGFSIAVTADRRREEQAALIERRGGEVCFGPVIRTLALAAEGPVQAATNALVRHPPDIAVLCTGVGVRGWLSAAEGLGLHGDLIAVLADAEVLARGPKAAGAAHTAGVEVDWTAPTATYAEMIDRLSRRPTSHADGRPVRIAVQLDGDRESGLAHDLEALGYAVVAVPVYEWLLPDDLEPARRVAVSVADRSVDAVTFTSAHAVKNFAAIADELGLLPRVLAALNRGGVVVGCVGPVTAARARSVGVEAPVEPRAARLGAMVQALVAVFTQRAITLDLDGTPAVLQGRLVEVGRGGRQVTLTDRERAVLEALARRRGAVVSKQALLSQIWDGESDDHVVEVTVGRLRRRLGSAGDSIETVVRRGYRLTAG